MRVEKRLTIILIFFIVRKNIMYQYINHRDSQEAFKEAIQHGYLETIDHNNNKYAGDYMYMHTIENTDYFKNINTREYMEVEYY